MKKEIEKLKEDALLELKECVSLKDVENFRVKYFGKKGRLTGILKGLGKLPKEERPVIGKLANQVKQYLLNLVEDRILKIQKDEVQKRILQEKIDITLPGEEIDIGHIHPISLTLRKICDIFIGLGFKVVEGPEVENEYYNFEALNIPADHPSREMWDSFYFGDGLLLRSHTSPVQIRVMEKAKPPVKVVVPGKCYRRDAVDATHHWMFHQIEGLLVDDRVTFADLKGVLLHFAKQMFGKERRVRFTPSYFPFTEPSAEMSIDCFVCNGRGCRVCKGTGWIEILGSGMVNPKVLEEVGYDPEVYQGFAFGMGIERIAMLKYGINDIRLFFENDIRFLKQF